MFTESRVRDYPRLRRETRESFELPRYFIRDATSVPRDSQPVHSLHRHSLPSYEVGVKVEGLGMKYSMGGWLYGALLSPVR